MYDKYVDISKNFKASVNLEFDLQNEEKVAEYIPTTDLCDVIKKYIKNFLGNSNFKATTLSGPYGKGKSYLLLMILYLLSKRTNKILYEKVCKKIKNIDNELYKLLVEIDNKGHYLLPIIINNNAYTDLNKNFLGALSNSLNQFGFSDIVPNTSYSEALSIISKWEDDKENGFDIVKVCLKRLNLNLENIKNGLKNYDSNSFKNFTDLYSCVSHGLEFFSMKGEDIITIFKEVNYKITQKDKKCKGMFVVFDEFGSFLNNQSDDFVIKLNKIQSFAEMCNSSEYDMQFHFCCITHKDLLLYKKDKAYNDAFDTIAGRFESVRFDRSLDENYQIICSSLLKKSGYIDLVAQFRNNNKLLLSNISETGLFSPDQLEYIIDNGFPFNPMALYVLVQVSQILAQNERTLFTFLSDNDIDGFRYFISNFSENKILNVDTIYNYFESLIKENDEYKMLYYKVVALQRGSIKNEEHKIFKAIALIKIINDTLKLNCTIKNIALCLAMTEEECQVIINNLVERKILKRNVNDDSIDFSIVADKEINKMISDLVDLKFNDIDLSKAFTEFDCGKYIISNEYNFNYKMVRYYKVIYLESSKMVQLNSLDMVIEENLRKEFFDGLIINVINDSKMSISQVKQLLDNSRENIIVRYLSDNINKEVINKIKELSAIKALCNDKKTLSDNVVKTLPLLIEDMTSEINVYLFESYSKSRPINKVDYKDKNIISLIKKSFESYYNKTVLFNNEQVNKNDVQSVTLKARNYIIDLILNQRNVKNEKISQTSQEMTIYNSFENSNKTEIISLLKHIICESNGNKISFSNIVSLLATSPYGMRNGIVPIYIAKAISELSIADEKNVETIILYNNKVEIDLNANNLTKACISPKDYFYCYKSVNSNKIEMTYRLLELFNCSRVPSFSENIKNLNQCIKLFVSNLSPIIVKSNKKDNLLKLSENSINFKDLYLSFNNNNYELLFEKMPNIFNKTYIDLYDSLKIVKDEYLLKIQELYMNIINETKKMFGIIDGSLKSGIEEWFNKYPKISNILFENNHKSIYAALKNLSFNDELAINTISFGCINCALDDYNTKKYVDYFRNLKSFIEKVETYDEKISASKEQFETYKLENIKLSSLANTLYSNIVDSVEEYGDAISNEEKALIYKKLLNDLLK